MSSDAGNVRLPNIMPVFQLDSHSFRFTLKTIFESPRPSLLLGRSLVGTVFALQSRSPAWHSGHTLRTRAYSTAEVDGRPPVSPWLEEEGEGEAGGIIKGGFSVVGWLGWMFVYQEAGGRVECGSGALVSLKSTF